MTQVSLGTDTPSEIFASVCSFMTKTRLTNHVAGYAGMSSSRTTWLGQPRVSSLRFRSPRASLTETSWAAVWCYDYLLTLDREIQCFWGSKWSFNRVLFIGYRYPALANTGLDYLASLPWSSWQNYWVSAASLSSSSQYPTARSTEV